MEEPHLDWPTRRTIDALENISAHLEVLMVLKEHELGVHVEYAPEGGGPYVPRGSEEAGDVREVMNAEEAAEFCRISLSHFKNLAAAGEIPRHTIGELRHVYVRSELLERVMAR